MYDENSNATAATLVALNNAPVVTSTASTPAANSTLMNQLLNVKDSRWLQLEVCREYQRGQCSRSDLECKFAHPPAHVDIQNGRVTACYDSIKGRCTRENPKCKYLHPPQHLKDQLLINGRNNLALKTLLCSQLTNQGGLPAGMPPMAAQLVQTQQSQQPTLMPAMPYPQYYSPLTAVYPTLIPSGDPYQVQNPSSAAVLQQLALLQQSGAVASSSVSPQPNQNALLLQAALLQQQQQQQAALAQSGLLQGGMLQGLGGSAMNAALLQQHFASVAASSAATMATQQATAGLDSQSRKRPAHVAGLENGSGSEEQSAGGGTASSHLAGGSLTAIHHASGGGSGAATASGAIASATDSAVNLAALQNQMLLAAAANNGLKRSAVDKNGVPTAMPAMYTQAAQFSPYVMSIPGYAPVSFSGPLPPRY